MLLIKLLITGIYEETNAGDARLQSSFVPVVKVLLEASADGGFIGKDQHPEVCAQ